MRPRRISSLRPRAAVTPAALLLALDPVAGLAQGAEGTRKLDEVVVTASGFAQEVKDAPASITIVSAEKLQEQRNASIAEALSDVEGIDTGGTRGKTGGLNVSMRGMPSEYTLVLIDGRRQNSAGSVTPNGFGETSTSFLPPMSSIERIEVVRGPMSTLYGSDAMGGVVNIITRKVRPEWGASLSTDGTFQENTEFGNSYSSSLYLDGPLLTDKLGLAIRGSYFRRDESELVPTGEVGSTTVISTRGPSPVESDIYSVGTRLSFTPNDANDIWLDADIARQKYDNEFGQLGTLDRPNATPPSFNGYGPEQKFNRDQFTLAHTLRWGDATIDSSYMINETETIGRTLPTGTPGGPPGSGAPNKVPGSARTLENQNKIFDTKLTSSWGPNTFTVGGQHWEAEMIDGVALTPFEHTQWSVFAENEWRIVDSLALTVGARFDDHNVFGDHTSPRAYLVWNPTESWTFKGGVSEGFKTPRLEQLQEGIVGFGGQGTIALIGSPTLTPETTTSTELVAAFESENGIRVSATLFNNEFEDKIASGPSVPNCTYVPAPNLPGCLNFGNFPTQVSFSQSINVDEAVTRGGEFALNVPVGERWTVQTNYTYTESEQKSGPERGLPLTDTPEHMINASVRWRATERLDAWVRSEYRSERYRTAGPARVALGDYKAYSVVHLGGGYMLSDRVTVNATIYNLLDKDFLEYGSYAGVPSGANPSGLVYSNLYNNHQEARRLWLSATFVF